MAQHECTRTLLVYAFCKIETSTFVRHEGGFQLDTEMSMIALKQIPANISLPLPANTSHYQGRVKLTGTGSWEYM